MGSIATNKWTVKRLHKQKNWIGQLIKEGFKDMTGYDSVLEEILRVRNIISSPVIGQWANEIFKIQEEADRRAYEDQRHPFSDQNNPFEKRLAEACDVLFDGLQEHVEQRYAQWSPENIKQYRQNLRKQDMSAFRELMICTSAFSAMTELERLQRIVMQSDIKCYVEDILRTFKQTTMMRFDESFDLDGTKRYVSPDTATREEYEKGNKEIVDSLIYHLQLYIDQGVWLSLGGNKLKWQVYGRHKDWVKGITITESRANGFANGPENTSLPLARFFAKPSGFGTFNVYEGPYYRGTAKKVVCSVVDIINREAAGDKSIYPEYGKAFLDMADQA